MAEFSRKSRSKRILENIDTARSSKAEVYQFYQKWRKQYGLKDKSLSSSAKKSEIVRELYKLEAYQSGKIKQRPVELFEEQYKKIKEQQPSNQTTQQLEKLQAKADKLLKAGKISKAAANLFQTSTEQPKARHKEKAERTQRANVYYKGRYAHDYIKKMIDDSIINDSDDFEDSQEIWYTLDLIKQNSDDLDFFKKHYAGESKEGSRDYYLGKDGFEDFLQNCQEFEDYLTSKNEKIPAKYSDEYWNALKKYLAEKGGAVL